MPGSTVYPNQGFQRSFNHRATYPYARYDSDEEENELDRARELYKNLQGSPGGWQTRALQGQSQQLKRRLGETEKSFQEREVEYKRRLREGEDVRSLLGSQLDESRSQYGNLQRQLDESRSQYGDLQSQFGDERSLYHGKLADFKRQQENQENEFNKYIHEPEIADQILRKKYNLERGLYDLTMKKPWPEIKNYADEQGYTGNYKKYADQFISGASQQKPFMSYEDFERRNHNKAFMTSLMPQFEKKYPKGNMDEAQYLTHLGYGDPTYSKNPVSFLKQYQKYYPFAKEDTYQKYPTTDKFRDFSPASKHYLNIDQPDLKNFNKIYKQKLAHDQLDHASELQSQSERFSEMHDKSIDPFANLLRDIQPGKYDEIMSGEMTPKMSQSSIYSLNAPKSFYESIKSNYDWQARERQKQASELEQMREKYGKDIAERQSLYDKAIQESGAFKKKSQGDILTRDAELERLRPLQTETEQLRAERNKLEDFRKKYWHMDLRDYDRHKEFYNTYKNMDFGSYQDLPHYFKPLDQFKTQYQNLAKYDNHVKEFMRVWPGTKDKEFHPKKTFDVPDYEASVPKTLVQLNELGAFAKKNRENYQEMMKRRYMMESYARKYPDQAHNYGLQRLGLGNDNIPAQTMKNPYPWAKR